MTIVFRFSPAKAAAAIQLMLSEHSLFDLHSGLKACYFADVSHLNAHHRPIFGASYRAMKFGPVPVEVYEMMKGDPLWLAEIGAAAYPWRLEGYHLRRLGNRDLDVDDTLAASDREHLEAGIERSFSMDFNERTAATHGPDWQNAALGWMQYEDMLAETSQKPAIVADLKENGRRMRL